MSDPTETYRPGLEGVIATETAVSFLDLDTEQIVIRGYDLIELAREVRYPVVAFLLMHGELPTDAERTAFDERLRRDAPLPPGMETVLRSLPPATDAMDALRTGVSALAGFEDPAVLADTSHAANLDKATRIIARPPGVRGPAAARAGVPGTRTADRSRGTTPRPPRRGRGDRAWRSRASSRSWSAP